MHSSFGVIVAREPRETSQEPVCELAIQVVDISGKNQLTDNILAALHYTFGEMSDVNSKRIAE
jgi:hypothetical protein